MSSLPYSGVSFCWSWQSPLPSWCGQPDDGKIVRGATSPGPGSRYGMLLDRGRLNESGYGAGNGSGLAAAALVWPRS